MSKQFYTSIAPYYQHIFPFNPSQVRFLSTVLPYNGARVLDIGCATGELAFALSRFGFPIWAFDDDAQMIEIAKNNKSEDNIFPIFEQMDMRQFDQFYPEAFFDTIICFGNTLVHLLNDQDIKQFLTAVHRSLATDGTFTFQILNYNHILDNHVSSLPIIDNEHIAFQRNYEFAEDDELINFKTTLTVKASGQVIENSVKLNPLKKEKLEAMLTETGFDNMKYFGNFDGGPLQPNSLPFIVTCNKKQQGV